MTTTVFKNANIIMANEVINGCLTIQDTTITDISSSATSVPAAIDCEQHYLLPGLIELHTDNLEKHFSPRPKVTWPGQPAVVAHDAQLVASGITTVFDAVALGDVNEGSQRLENLQSMLDAIEHAKQKNILRAEHRLHLRCEVSHHGVVSLFEKLADTPSVNLVSVMDHSPGQRQFTNMDKYRTYYQGKFHLTNDEMDVFIKTQKDNALRYSDTHRKKIVDICRQRNIPLASHDDATAEHVQESVSCGMTIAEFPTTKTAAELSHQKNMYVMMGAPNVVRGGSHSGNIAAHELAASGVLDILSSDYCPASILHAAFTLADLDNDYDVAKAIRTVTYNPAKAAGLMDRGEIAINKRADFLLVNTIDQYPVVNKVWAQGQRVF